MFSMKLDNKVLGKMLISVSEKNQKGYTYITPKTLGKKLIELPFVGSGIKVERSSFNNYYLYYPNSDKQLELCANKILKDLYNKSNHKNYLFMWDIQESECPMFMESIINDNNIVENYKYFLWDWDKMEDPILGEIMCLILSSVVAFALNGKEWKQITLK